MAWTFHAVLASTGSAGLAFLVTSIGQVLVVAGLECVMPYRVEWSWRRDRQSINDVAHCLLNTAIAPLLTASLAAAAVAAAAELRAALGHTIWPAHWPAAVQFVAVVVVADFMDWFKHWLFHRVPFLWRIHALHHNSTALHVGKSLRFHLFETPIRYLMLSAPLIAIGVPAEFLLWYLAAMGILGKLNHSNLDLAVPSWLHYVIATPQVHRLHHSLDRDLGRSNLSAITVLPDLVFGTFRRPDRHAVGDCGIEPDDLPASVHGQFFYPLLGWRRRR